MYVYTNLARTEHIQHEFKCMSVQTEPILNIIWYQFKCMTVQIEPRLNIYGINSYVCLYKFISFLTKLVIRIMKAEVSDKIWIQILWCKSKCWEQYSLGHYLKTISLYRILFYFSLLDLWVTVPQWWMDWTLPQ